MVDLDALEQALNAATPGNWDWWRQDFSNACETVEQYFLGETGVKTWCDLDADTEFIALAHNQMADLIAELRLLRNNRNLTDEVAFVHLIRGLRLNITEREVLVTLYRAKGWDVAVQQAYEMARK